MELSKFAIIIDALETDSASSVTTETTLNCEKSLLLGRHLVTDLF